MPGPGRARKGPAPAKLTDRLSDRGEIARGGMGVIRKVFDARAERHAALKVIDPELATHPEALGRFLDEARITGQLDHPNIVPVYDLIADAGGAPSALLMKLIEGETLTARIARVHPPSERDLMRLIEIFLKVCDAVAFAHSRGVIHRDLKPDNVMIGEFGQVYVMDWGCAHVLARARLRGQARREGAPRRTFVEADGTVIGTPGYMAPEQAWGATAELDERTDVFGLGGILYHILTGDAPYPAETTSGAVTAARRGAPAPPHDVVDDHVLPPVLCRIAMRALATAPADRYASVEDLRLELEAFVRGGSFLTARTFAPGTVIVKEGDPADAAYVVTEGTCEAYRKRGNRRITLRTFGAGEVFGEGALFAVGARNATVAAIDQVTAVVVSRELLHEELALDSWMGAFVRALAGRHRDLDARQRLVHQVGEHHRITYAIVDHISRAGSWVGDGVLAAPWSRLWAALAPELRVSEAVALAAIERTGDLAVDRERDVITLDVPSADG